MTGSFHICHHLFHIYNKQVFIYLHMLPLIFTYITIFTFVTLFMFECPIATSYAPWPFCIHFLRTSTTSQSTLHIYNINADNLHKMHNYTYIPVFIFLSIMLIFLQRESYNECVILLIQQQACTWLKSLLFLNSNFSCPGYFV